MDEEKEAVMSDEERAEAMFQAGLDAPGKRTFHPGGEPTKEQPKDEDGTPEDLIDNAVDPKGKTEDTDADKKGAKTTPDKAATEDTDADTDDLIASAVGLKKQAPPKVTAPVKEWFEKNGYGDPAAIIEELPSLRKEAEQLREKAKLADERLDTLDKLDLDLRNAIRLASEGKDWKQVLGRPSLDFSIEADKHDPKTLIDTYAPGKVSAEDWEEYADEDGDPKVKRFVDATLEAAKVKYDKDRSEATSLIEGMDRQAKERQQKYDTSYEASLNHVFSAIPGSKGHKAEFEKAFRDIGKMFIGDDGATVRPEAILNAWRIKNFDALLAAAERKAEQRARDVGAIDLARRTDQRREVARADSGDPGRTKIEQQVDEFFKSHL